MSRSHRAGGPEYNPNTGMHVNIEHTETPLERTLRSTPVDEHPKGVNFPYRGQEQHGVPYDQTIPEELEGAPGSEDLEMVLPPHYAPRPHTPAPVPVRIVSEDVCERKMWLADQYTVHDSVASAPLMILGRQDNRQHFVIRNMDAANNVYIGPDPNVNIGSGFQIGPNSTTFRFETTEAVYAVTEAGKTAQVSIMWEYTVGV